MCQNQMRLRGVRVMGRQVYVVDVDQVNVNDVRVKLGWNGPTVPYGAALADLSNDAADRLAGNVQALRTRVQKGEVRVDRYGTPCTPSLAEVSPVAGLLTADEPAVTLTPADAWERLDAEPYAELEEEGRQERELNEGN
jgi:hypothetical protein